MDCQHNNITMTQSTQLTTQLQVPTPNDRLTRLISAEWKSDTNTKPYSLITLIDIWSTPWPPSPHHTHPMWWGCWRSLTKSHLQGRNCRNPSSTRLFNPFEWPQDLCWLRHHLRHRYQTLWIGPALVERSVTEPVQRHCMNGITDIAEYDSSLPYHATTEVRTGFGSTFQE